MTSIQLAAMLLALSGIACTARTRSNNPGEATHAPSLLSLTPDSASASAAGGVLVTVQGGHFLPARNTVLFGAVEIHDVPATHEGTELSFRVPSLRFEADHDAPAAPLPQGRYFVQIRNSHGVSRALPFTIVQ